MKKVICGLILFVGFMLCGRQASAQISINGDAKQAIEELKNMGLSDQEINVMIERYGNKAQRESNLTEKDSSEADKVLADEVEQKLKSKKDSVSNTKKDKKEKDDKKTVKKDKNKKDFQEEFDSLGHPLRLPEGKIYGQDIFRNKAITVYQKASTIKAPDSYVVGAGDEIAISIWGYTDFNESVRVSESGYMSSKILGRVYVKGLMLKDVRALLHKKYANVTEINNSQYDIAVNSIRTIAVNVVGEVFYPGTYTLSAINTAFNSLVAGSGPTDIGSVRNIYIRRDGKTIDSLDVYQFLMNPGLKGDVYLQSGDYVVVEVAKKVIKLAGEVKRPHNYELKASEGITYLLKYAGGANASAFTQNIHIYRYEKNRQVLIDVNLDSLRKTNGEFMLQDADSVYVSPIPKGVDFKVSVKGAVRLEGDFQIRQGDRISDLLRRAQGPTTNAYLERAFLYRENPDLSKRFVLVNVANVIANESSASNLELQNKDVLRLVSKDDFSDSLKVKVFGDIRKPGDYDYGSGISLSDAVVLSGGLKIGASTKQIEVSRIISYNQDNDILTPVRAVVYSVNISGDMKLGSEAENFKLEPLDQVFVRTNPEFEQPKTIFLTGEVQYPGQYSLLRKDEKVSDIIERAGGLTPYAFLDGVKMYRKVDSTGFVYLNLEKAMNRKSSRFNQVLVHNDSISIPKTMNLVQIVGGHGNIKEKNVNCPYSGKRAKYYIRNFAGGFLPNAKRSGVYVVHANGIVRTTTNLGIVKIYPKIGKGSTINIPIKPDRKKNRNSNFDTNKFIESTTIKLTALLTLIILARTLSTN